MSQNQTSDFSNITEEIEELEAKIQERKDFLDKVKECVVEVTQKIGMVENNYNVHTVREFAGFGFFSFYYSTKETPLGGRAIKVKYLDKLILHFIFPAFADSEYKVLIFDDSGSWQEAIGRGIANKEFFINNYLRDAKRGNDEALEKERVEARLLQLQKEAKQLAILY